QLDDTLAEAHTTLALAIWLYDFDSAQAIREFQRAIELNPNYAIAHQQYGNNTLAALGRFDDAIGEGKRAVELDPLSLVINTDLGSDYYYARRYDEAIAQLRKTLEMDPGFYIAHLVLGQVLDAKGARDAAIVECQKARALNDDPSVLGVLGRAHGLSGNKMEAEKILDQLKKLSQERYVSAYSFALCNIGLGDKEEALRWLEQSYQDRAGSDVGYIRVDPLLDRLRGDPRCGALVFRTSPEAPALCALEISKALKRHPELQVRMGIHSGPVNEVTDLNEQANIAGAGINIAQRVMDCGDAGHILVSKRVADDLENYAQWRPLLHDLGTCEVKHGATLGIVNLYSDEIGNPETPKKFKGEEAGEKKPGVPILRKSIAVLPFENLSEDKANVYFADGIQEEI